MQSIYIIIPFYRNKVNRRYDNCMILLFYETAFVCNAEYTFSLRALISRSPVCKL